MIVEQQVAKGADEVHDEGVPVAGIVAEGDVSAANDEVPTAVEEPSIPSPTPPTPPSEPSQDITKLKSRVKKLERINKASKLKRLKKVGSAQRIDTSDDTILDDVSKQGGIITNIDADEDVVLEDAKDVAADGQDADIDEIADIQGRTTESQAQIYKIDLEYANKVLSMKDEEESEPIELQEVVDVVTTAKIITEVVTDASDTITAATTAVTAVHQWHLLKQVGDLSTHTTKYISPALTHKVFANMRRVGKGFSRVETLLFEGMIVEQKVAEGADEVHDEGVPIAGIVTEGDVSAANDEVPTAVEEPSIPSPTPPTPPPEPSQDVPSTSQGGIITNIDADEDVVLEDAKDVAVDGQDANIDESADIQGRTTESQAQIYKIELEYANKVLTAIIHFEAKSKDKGKGILVEEPKPLKKQAQIEQDEKYARELEAELNRYIDWDEVIDHVQGKQKEDKAVKRYQALERKP
nr:hypothetical protein [Tanacetum cinerariifolium]